MADSTPRESPEPEPEPAFRVPAFLTTAFLSAQELRTVFSDLYLIPSPNGLADHVYPNGWVAETRRRLVEKSPDMPFTRRAQEERASKLLSIVLGVIAVNTIVGWIWGP